MAEIYLRREDVLDALCNASVPTFNLFGKPILDVDYVPAIKSIPAADVRPVVLCKDCMYAPSITDGGEDQDFALEWPHDEWPEDNPCPCKCDDEWYSYKPNTEFYCAHGKREES